MKRKGGRPSKGPRVAMTARLTPPQAEAVTILSARLGIPAGEALAQAAALWVDQDRHHLEQDALVADLRAEVAALKAYAAQRDREARRAERAALEAGARRKVRAARRQPVQAGPQAVLAGSCGHPLPPDALAAGAALCPPCAAQAVAQAYRADHGAGLHGPGGTGPLAGCPDCGSTIPAAGGPPGPG